MFDDDFYREAKWFIAVFDIAIIAFLSSRLVDVVADVIENSDVVIAASITVGHFWATMLVCTAFGGLFLYWLSRLNMETRNAVADGDIPESVKHIRLTFGVVAFVVVGMELAATYQAFALAAVDPYAVTDPPPIKSILNVFFAVLAVGAHVISAFMSAKTYKVLKGEAVSAGSSYIPPSKREEK